MDGEQPAVLHPNASLLPYELFQPHCFAQGYGRTTKKTLKAVLKDEWMRARIKGAAKNEVQKKKKNPVSRKHKHGPQSSGRGTEEGGKHSAAPASQVVYFFMGV